MRNEKGMLRSAVMKKTCLIRSVCIAFCLIPCGAWTIPTQQALHLHLAPSTSREYRQGKRLGSSSVVSPFRGVTSLKATDSEGDDVTPRKSKLTAARVGGRSPRSNRAPSSGNKEGGGIPKWVSFLAPLLLLWFLFGSLFGGTDSSYVYYQSSVYETYSYGVDGRVETTRKESVRSNLPSLLEPSRNQNDDLSSSPSSSYFFQRSNQADEEFDRELDSLMRFQRTILDDYFF